MLGRADGAATEETATVPARPEGDAMDPISRRNMLVAAAAGGLLTGATV
ncbi:MAG: hypothetical protein JWM53_3287, partial [bacterium]|nr:hypothetical protein [bacterium]